MSENIPNEWDETHTNVCYHLGRPQSHAPVLEAPRPPGF